MKTHDRRCASHQLRVTILPLAAAVASAACADPWSVPGQGAAGSTAAPGGGLFTAPNPWNLDVSALPRSAASDAIVRWLASHGGWGTGELRIDFGMQVLLADAAAPFRTFTPTDDFYVPDCDQVPFPVPARGALEGEDGYACAGGGDCHLLVVHEPSRKLYEMWQADLHGDEFRGGCAAVWELERSYGASLRGEDCTSADAGGFPVSAMLFSADEVASGVIDHAVRFILPNHRIRRGVYAHPATHATGAAAGGPEAPPYGVRFRLRADYPDQLSPGARVVARAMQRYGMILADGGNIALTAQSDRFTTHTWSEVGVDSRSLAAIEVEDMEVVALDAPVPYTGACARQP